MSAEDAQNALTALNLTANVVMMDLPEGDPKIGTVVSTDPAAGTQVAPGSTVTINVGQQMAPAENSDSMENADSTDNGTENSTDNN